MNKQSTLRALGFLAVLATSTLWLLFVIDLWNNGAATHPPFEVYYIYSTGNVTYAISAGLPAAALCLLCAIPRTLNCLFPQHTAWKAWYAGAAALLLTALTLCMLPASDWFVAFARNLLGYRASAILEQMIASYIHSIVPALALCVICWLICIAANLYRSPARIPQAVRQTAKHLVCSLVIVFLITVSSLLILNILASRGVVRKGWLDAFCSYNAYSVGHARVSVLWAPVVEEIAFRALICMGLAKYGRRWLAILISAVFFGLWHRNMTQFAYTVVWGIIFGSIILNTGTVFWSMLMHSLSNLLVILAYSNSSSMVFGAWPQLYAFRVWLGDLSVVTSALLLILISAGTVILLRHYRPSEAPVSSAAVATE